MQTVVKTFQSAAGEVTVLKGINLDVFAGEFVSIVGRSGSGKSTLLNMLTGIDHPTSGSVTIGGMRLHTLGESEMAAWRGRNLGIVFQFFQLLPMLSLIENVMLPMDLCDCFPPAEREIRAGKLLERVGLKGFEHALPTVVSGGQQQCAAVARALATDPPILVADEPTGNLDTRTAEQVMQLFQEQVGVGKTVLLVTHDSLLARQTQRSLILSDGELIPPALVQVFPELSHAALLKLAHLSRPFRLAAGESINPEFGLLIVTSGCLEAVPGNASIVSEAGQRDFQPGDLVDEAALHQAGLALQASRAGSSGVVCEGLKLELGGSPEDYW